MAAVSGIKLHWVDGIMGDTVVDKALPPPATHKFRSANIGSWRGHLNALQEYNPPPLLIPSFDI